MSRTAAGAIQNFANNTCSVYITYSKEDEAVRCIQSVNGFVLQGNPLRACFGTTKYCHSWLRNVPCSIPDCLYLHEFGSQENSFIKDEMIPAYTRVQQITGASNGMQRRLGNMLPPPADDYTQVSTTSSGKDTSRSTLNNTIMSVRDSPPNNTSGHSIACPVSVSWPSKKMPESVSGSMDFSTAVASTIKTQSNGGDGKKLIPNEGGLKMLHTVKYEPLESIRPHTSEDWRSTESVVPASGLSAASKNTQLHYSMKHEVNHGNVEQNGSTTSIDFSKQSYSSTLEKELNVHSEGKMRNLCSSLLSVGINRHAGDEHSGDTWDDQVHSDDKFAMITQGPDLKQLHNEQSTECLTSVIMRNGTDLADDIHISTEQLGCGLNSVARENSQTMLDSPILVAKVDSHVVNDEVEEDLRHFDKQRLKDPEVSRPNGFLTSSHTFHLSNHLRDQVQPFEQCESPIVKLESPFKSPFSNSSGVSAVHNGYPEFLLNRVADLNQSVGQFPSEVNSVHRQSSETQFASVDQSCPLDMGENNIISNMNFDAWDTPLAPPQIFSNFLGESDNHQGTLNVSSSSWKGQNNSQSRFSFAREEDPRYERSYYESALGSTGRFSPEHLLNHHDISNRRDVNSANLGSRGFYSSNFQEPDIFSSGYSNIPSNKFPVPSRTQNTAPPGFSAPSRTPPPPGFASHERIEQPFDPMSGNHLLNISPLLRNSYQAPPTVNAGSSTLGIEFMDPAIMAVCEGTTLSGGYHHYPGGGSALDIRTSLPLQMGYFENEYDRLHLLMQQRLSLSPLQQNHQRHAEIGDIYSTTSTSVNDAYGIPSSRTTMNQPLPNRNHTPSSRSSGLVPNEQWDQWNEVVSNRNEVGMTDNNLRTERLGFNKSHNGYDDSSSNFFMGPYGV
ncbi:uncharacterized protein LOC124916755 isoform X2 [Impatiens glandulifera]|nr:uncharacterized protein LOC124916755 isoform X2 [Impatiens glandulifera]